MKEMKRVQCVVKLFAAAKKKLLKITQNRNAQVNLG